MTTTTREIIERLRLQMPMVVTLPDPITGEPFTANRDNLLALLVIDVNDLIFEAQTVAALFGEISRVRNAAWRAHQESEVRLRKWKASKREECRRVSDKEPNARKLDDYYQNLPDYEERYNETIQLATLVSLTDDLKKAFEIKSFALRDLSSETFGHNRIQNTNERISEMELEQLAEKTIAESGSAAAAADFRENSQQEQAQEETKEEKPKRKPKREKVASKKKSSKKARTIK